MSEPNLKAPWYCKFWWALSPWVTPIFDAISSWLWRIDERRNRRALVRELNAHRQVGEATDLSVRLPGNKPGCNR